MAWRDTLMHWCDSSDVAPSRIAASPPQTRGPRTAQVGRALGRSPSARSRVLRALAVAAAIVPVGPIAAAPAIPVAPYVGDGDTALLLHFDGSLADAAHGAKAEAKATAWTDGLAGQALSCDGNQRIRVAADGVGSLAGGFTVEAWLRLKRPQVKGEKRVVQWPGSFEWRMGSYPRENAKVMLEVWTDRGRFLTKTRGFVPYGKWVHVACRYDPKPPGKDAVALFINGTPAAKLVGFQDISQPKGRLRKGRGALVIADGLLADVDELRLSSKARKASDLTCPWLSGREGDFQPFAPDVTASEAPAGWPANAAWLTAAKAASTFECIGLRAPYAGDRNRNAHCRVRYREQGGQWRQGMDLIPCPKDGEFRGSLLWLKPGTTYQIELQAADPDAKGEPQRLALAAATWAEAVPIAETRKLPAGIVAKPLVIEAKGSPDGWIRYAPPDGLPTTIDAGTQARAAVSIRNSAFVIVEGLVIRGGTKDAVSVGDSRHVRIRGCEMAGWGTPGTRGPDGRFVGENGRLINYHTGVFIGPGTSQIVVEHNFMHAPRGTANSWEFGHPVGPQGVVICNTEGNHVVRYNDVVGDERHWWNDAIESISNGAVGGGPYRDTDIYGNVLFFSNDDGTELDGGQINVRYWHNWIETALCGVSCAPCVKGPCYVFRNVIAHLGDERGKPGSAFKMGGGQAWSPGLDLILHNTIYGKGGGLCSVGYATSSGYRAFSRNNLFAGPKSYIDVLDKSRPPVSDFDYDLIARRGARVAEGNERHAVTDAPEFLDARHGDWRLAAGSPGIDAGVGLPGVNDGFRGAAPDMGAFEQGSGRGFPSRPGGLLLWPPRVVTTAMRDSAQPVRVQVELVAPAGAGKTWAASCNSPWLRCEPASGRCLDRGQTLAILCDGSKAECGDRRGAVTIRTDGGYCRTAPVDVRVMLTPVVRVLEAEAGRLAGAMEKGRDDSASAGRYIHRPIPPAGPDGKPQAGPPGSATYVFDVPADGTYYVTGRVYAPEPSGMHDSFYFAMDGAKRAIWDVRVGPEWQWVLLSERGAPSRRPFLLQAGRHTLDLASREFGTRLDRIALTNNPCPDPTELETPQ